MRRSELPSNRCDESAGLPFSGAFYGALRESVNRQENEMNSTKDVIENHIRRFREGNIKGVLDDFSPDAILLTPTEVLKGRRNHR